MKLKVAFQMDPMESIDISGDSTFALALEGQRRGHELYHYLPSSMSLNEGLLKASVKYLEVRDNINNYFSYGPPKHKSLSDFDVILMRQDPPFDMAYITSTHLLEHIHPKTLVVNNPYHVRNAPEKIFVTNFMEFMPPTLISKNINEIRSFREKYNDIVIKPLFGNGGFGVFHVTPNDENLNSLVEFFSAYFREPIVIQAYLPEVKLGDKRIILVNGQAVGAISRVPAEGEARANLHVGATAHRTKLTEKEKIICNTIGPKLRENGLLFVGIDVIGDYLTEINVTSPTGIREISALDGIKVDVKIWDAIETQIQHSVNS
ncbi:MAG: glutathione synthase [Gammaproteobacteria bacterium]|nr:glutathione synthase [Gammaproteobacteria bacterium]